MKHTRIIITSLVALLYPVVETNSFLFPGNRDLTKFCVGCVKADLEEDNNFIQEYTWFDANNYFKGLLDPSYGQDELIIPIYLYEDGVVFPTSDVPIHFIVREDIEMMEYIQTRGNTFGMVLSEDGKFCEIGTLIENLSQTVMPDKTLVSYNKGKQRFRIVQVLQEQPFMLAKVSLDVWDVLDSNVNLEDTHELQLDVFDDLKEVMELTNYNSGINGSLTTSVLEYAPTIKFQNSSNYISNSIPEISIERELLNYMTFFSFAVCDMIAVRTEDRQSLLEHLSLNKRFRHLRKILKANKSFLLGTLFEESMPTITCEDDGYYIINQKRKVGNIHNIFPRFNLTLNFLKAFSITSDAADMRTYIVIINDYTGNPIKISDSYSLNRFKPAILASVLGIGGKLFLDGPNFNEPVSLLGKTAVITGGNTGLGKETALKLYTLGADTIILCRDSNKAKAAIDDIRQRSKQTGNLKNSLSYVNLDLTNLKKIEKSATELKKITDRIDILVNNAGVMAIPSRELTSDGFEKHIGINHLGHFALTGHLLSLLKKSPSSRVVSVSSAAHLLADKGISSDPNLIISKPEYEPWTAYGNSKLANILFTKKLAEKLGSSSNIIPLVCHPGGCRTELGRYIFDPSSIPPLAIPFAAVAGAPLLYFTKSAEQGAQTQIFLSASQSIRPSDAGSYYDNSAKTGVSDLASNPKLADWLWKESERLTGISFDA